MAKVDLQAVIALTPAAVFDALRDGSRRRQLDPSTLSVHEESVIDGPLEAGATFAGISTATGEENAFDAVIVDLVLDERVTIAFRFGNGAVLTEAWRLRPTLSGTLVHYQAEMRLPGGFVGRILDVVLVGSGFRRQREVILRNVKAVLDTSG